MNDRKIVKKLPAALLFQLLNTRINLSKINVSIIIPTHNRRAALRQTLNSLVQVDFQPDKLEILVIDNGSVDQTSEAFESIRYSFPDRRWLYFNDPVPGLLSGRHRGAKEAQGNLLVFIDDDIDADPGWLQAIVNTFADHSVQLVGGRNLPHYEVTPPAWLDSFWGKTPHGGRACGYLSLLDLGDTILDIDANYIWGLNFAIRRQALFDLGGFHPDCIPDHLQHFQGDGETGLTRKANAKGYRAVYQPKALVHHRISASRLTPEYFERRAFYQGVCDSFTTVRQSNSVPSQHIEIQSAQKSIGKRFKRYVRNPVSHVRNFTRRFLHSSVLSSDSQPMKDPEAAKIHARVKQAYQSGYEFHQNAVKRNPDLLKWVLRKDYWDYRLPDIPAPVHKERTTGTPARSVCSNMFF